MNNQDTTHETHGGSDITPSSLDKSNTQLDTQSDLTEISHDDVLEYRKKMQVHHMKKKKTRFFEIYISKVLKKISDRNGITSNAKQQLNSILCSTARIFSDTIITLTQVAKKRTVSPKEVENAAKLLLSEELVKYARNYALEAVDKFKNSRDSESVTSEATKSSVSRQEKANIIFPPAIAEKFLRQFGYTKIMVSSTSPVYFAVILEYLTFELLECACANASDNGRVRVTVRDLELAVRQDDDFDRFFTKHNLTFLGGGVVPFIHKSLLVKKNKKKAVKKADDSGVRKPHRFRPGTVCLREIKRHQKMSNCLTFAKSPFKKLVRQVLTEQNGGVPVKVSKDVFIILQYFIEQETVKVLKQANFAAIHSGRVKLMAKDINFVHALMRNEINPYEIELSEKDYEQNCDQDFVPDCDQECDGVHCTLTESDIEGDSVITSENSENSENLEHDETEDNV